MTGWVRLIIRFRRKFREHPEGLEKEKSLVWLTVLLLNIAFGIFSYNLTGRIIHHIGDNTEIANEKVYYQIFKWANYI